VGGENSKLQGPGKEVQPQILERTDEIIQGLERLHVGTGHADCWLLTTFLVNDDIHDDCQVVLYLHLRYRMPVVSSVC